MIVTTIVQTILLLLLTQALAHSTHEQNGFYLRVRGTNTQLEWRYIEVTKAGRLGLLQPSLSQHRAGLFKGTLRDGRLFSISPKGIVKQNPRTLDGGLGVVEHALANIGFCFIDQGPRQDALDQVLGSTNTPNSPLHNPYPIQFYLCLIPPDSPDLSPPDEWPWVDSYDAADAKLQSFYLYTIRHENCIPVMLVREDLGYHLTNSPSEWASHVDG